MNSPDDFLLTRMLTNIKLTRELGASGSGARRIPPSWCALRSLHEGGNFLSIANSTLRYISHASFWQKTQV